MTDQFRAVIPGETPNTVLYLLEAGDPEEAISLAAFTENPSAAQIFEGRGWLQQVAGFGAVLEQVV